MATEIWRELREKFRTLFRQCEGSAHNIDCSLVRPACRKAGKTFFEMLSDEQNLFALSDKFKQAPIAESMPPDGKPIEHYSEYWLCVLGFLAREGHIAVANYKLLNTQVPFSWAGIDCDLAIAERFFEDSKSYICEVCQGSIQACEKILEPSEWQPPEGYIGSKEIEQDHKVPRATLQGWQERDNLSVLKDPKTQENYYPESWLKEKLKNWKRK